MKFHALFSLMLVLAASPGRAQLLDEDPELAPILGAPAGHCPLTETSPGRFEHVCDGGAAAAKTYRQFRMTNYYLTKLSIVAAGTEGGVDILDLGGKRVATLTAKSKRALDIEGTGYWEEDGKTRYAHWQDHDTSNVGNKYKVDSKYPKGLAAFRTVAVDLGNKPNKDKKLGFKKGTKFYIQELDGLALPDGSTHDGWVTASDTGGNIAGLHFDFFCGTSEWAKSWAKDFKSKAKAQAGGYMVNVSWDGVEKVPADYVYGHKKTPPSSRAPKW